MLGHYWLPQFSIGAILANYWPSTGKILGNNLDSVLTDGTSPVILASHLPVMT